MEPIKDPRPIDLSQSLPKEEKGSDSRLADTEITRICNNIISAKPTTVWASGTKEKFIERCSPRLMDLRERQDTLTKSEKTLFKILMNADGRLNPLTDTQIIGVCDNIISAKPTDKWTPGTKEEFEAKCIPRLKDLRGRQGSLTKSEQTLFKQLEYANRKLNPPKMESKDKPPRYPKRLAPPSILPPSISSLSVSPPPFSDEEKDFNQHSFNVSNPEKPLHTYSKRELLEALQSVMSLQKHFESDPGHLKQLDTIFLKYKTALAGLGIHFTKDTPILSRINSLLARKDI